MSSLDFRRRDRARKTFISDQTQDGRRDGYGQCIVADLENGLAGFGLVLLVLYAAYIASMALGYGRPAMTL